MLNVMLIDDENTVLLGLSRLIDWNANDAAICGSFTDPFEAVSQAEKLKPDVIISDIEMPGMNGLELIASLAEKVPDTCFVILSAYDDFQYAKQSVALGVFRYLVKPLPAEELTLLLSDIRAKKASENKKHSARDMIRGLVFQDIILNGTGLRLSDSLSYYEQTESEGPFLLVCLRFLPLARNMFQDDSGIPGLLDSMDPLTLFRRNDDLLLLIREKENLSKLNEIRSTFGSICSLHVSDPFYRLRDSHQAYLSISGSSGEDTAETVSSGSPESVFYTQDQLIRKTTDYIEAHYSDTDFRLSDVADALYVNNSYLSHLYKIKTGSTLFNFLLETRMKHAATLLKHSGYSINDIARMVGYPAVKNFYSAFQKYFGISPKNYRRQNTNK